MKIRMKVTKFATPNGSTEEYVAGKTYDMTEPREILVARGFLAQKWAEEVAQAPEKDPAAKPKG